MSIDEFCLELKIDHEKIAFIKNVLIRDEIVDRLSDTFKVLADPTRIKIVFALLHGELCVCEISEIIGMSQSAVSHQLRKLKDMRIVKRRKSAKMVFYSLDDEHIINLLHECAGHVSEEFKEEVIIPKLNNVKT